MVLYSALSGCWPAWPDAPFTGAIVVLEQSVGEPTRQSARIVSGGLGIVGIDRLFVLGCLLGASRVEMVCLYVVHGACGRRTHFLE
jgi:hypothetical protein